MMAVVACFRYNSFPTALVQGIRMTRARKTGQKRRGLQPVLSALPCVACFRCNRSHLRPLLKSVDLSRGSF
jgi:hypothetical protein